MSVRLPIVPISGAPMGMPMAQVPMAMVAQPSYSAPPASRDLPDPAAVESQKAAYAASLEEQLAAGRKVIVAENSQKKTMFYDQAQQQKAVFTLNVDQEVKKQEMMLDQEMNRRLMELQKAAYDQRALLETQAANLCMEYNTKKAQEAFDTQQMTIMRTYDDAAQKIQAEAVKLGPAALPVQPASSLPMQPLMVAPPMAPTSQMAMRR